MTHNYNSQQDKGTWVLHTYNKEYPQTKLNCGPWAMVLVRKQTMGCEL